MSSSKPEAGNFATQRKPFGVLGGWFRVRCTLSVRKSELN